MKMMKSCILVIYLLVLWKTILASQTTMVNRKKPLCLVKTNLHILVDWIEEDWKDSTTGNTVFQFLRFLKPLTRDPCLDVQIFHPMKRSFVKINETNFYMTLERVQEDYRFQMVTVQKTEELDLKNNLKKSQVLQIADDKKYFCNKNTMTGSNENSRNIMLFISNFLNDNYKPLQKISDTGRCTLLVIAFLSPGGWGLEFLNWPPYYRLIVHIVHQFQPTNVNGVLQSHKDLLALIANPGFNRFHHRRLKAQSKFFNRSRTVCDFTVYTMIPDFINDPDVLEIDSVLQFVSLLTTTGLRIVAVVPPGELLKTMLQKLRIACIERENFDYQELQINFLITFPRPEDQRNWRKMISTKSCEPVTVEGSFIKVCTKELLEQKTLEDVLTKIKRHTLDYARRILCVTKEYRQSLG